MSRYSDQVRDEYGRTVPGVSIYVYKWDADADAAGDLETLTDDLSAPLANPLTSDADGLFYFNSVDGQKLIEYHFGGKVEFRDLILVGALPVPQAVFGGLFVNASALSIPVGMDEISTTGYSTLGVGAANYIYDAAVNSAYVAANPRSSFMSANSRGFRIDLEQDLTPQMFGAVADGTTNDYAAFAAALATLPARGGSLFIPRGYYRLTQKITTTKQVRIYGEGWSQNPGTVGVTTYASFNLYTGSIIVCDADVGGIEFVAFTDNASNATAYEFQSSLGSVLQNVMLYSLGGTGATAHGIESYVVLNLDNVRVEGFAGYGLKTSGDGAGTSSQYGNTALSSYRSVSCRYNKLSGFYTSGGNSSVIHFLGCDSANNGGVGFLDKSPFGNSYLSCHTSANNASYGTPAGYSAAQRTQNTTDWAGLSDTTAGSYVSTDAQGYSPFLGCYTELDTGYKAELSVAALVIGGLLATDAAHTTASVAPRWNSSILKNLGKVYSGANGVVEFAKGVVDITESNAYAGPSVGSRLQHSAVTGLGLAGVGSNYDVNIRNAAQTSVILIGHNSGDVQHPVSLSIGGGTPITKDAVYTPSITPASVAAATVAEQTFTVTGLTTADKVIVNPPAISNATGVAGARVSAADTLAIRFTNPTAGALTPTAGTYTVLAFRS